MIKRALDFSNALVYNLFRKVIGCVIRLPSVNTDFRNSIHFGWGMLFLFIIMIVYVRQSRKNN